MRIFLIAVTLEDGVEVEAESYDEALEKGKKEVERVLGKYIADHAYLEIDQSWEK